MQIWKALNLITVLLVANVMALAQSTHNPEEEVRNVISRFEVALQKHDVQVIEELVSRDIVVFENGHRNDGWQDFRDHHLLPEFKASSTQYKTEVVRVVQKKDDSPDVWTIYVLRRNETSWKIIMLDWSVRRVE